MFRRQNQLAVICLKGYRDAVCLMKEDFALSIKSNFLLGWTTSHTSSKSTYCLDGLFFLPPSVKHELLKARIALNSSVLDMILSASREDHTATMLMTNAQLLCVAFAFLCNFYTPVDFSTLLTPRFLKLLEIVYNFSSQEPFSGTSIYDPRVQPWVGSRVIYLDTIFSEENEGIVIEYNMTSNIITMRNEQGKIFKDFASRFTLVKEVEEVKHGSQYKGQKSEAFGKVETLTPLFINCLTSYPEVCNTLFCDTDNWVLYVIINARKFSYPMEQVASIRLLQNILERCTKIDPYLQSLMLHNLYTEIANLVRETTSQHPADYSNDCHDTRVCVLEEFKNVLQSISFSESWRAEYLQFISKSAENVITQTELLGPSGCVARDKDFIATCLLFSHILGVPRCGVQMTYSFQDYQAQHYFVFDVLSKDKLILVDQVTAKHYYVVEADSKSLINSDIHVTHHVDIDFIQADSSVRQFLVLVLTLASTQMALAPIELNQSVVWNYQIHLLALRALTGCILHNVDLVRWLLQQKCHQEYQELIEDNKQTLLDSFLSNSVLLPSIDFSNYSLNEIIASLNSVVNHLQWEDHYGKPSLSYIVDTSEMKDQKSQLVYTIGTFYFYLTKEDFLCTKDYFNYVKTHCYVGQFILPYHRDSNRRIYGVIQSIDENSVQAMYTCYAKSEVWFETETFDTILLVQSGTRYAFKLDDTVCVKKQISIPLLGWGNTGGHFTLGEIAEISKDVNDETIYIINSLDSRDSSVQDSQYECDSSDMDESEEETDSESSELEQSSEEFEERESNTVGELFNFIELFSPDNPILKLNNENLLTSWEDVITGYRVSSAEKQGPHLFMSNSYWQSEGQPGTHWIKLNIKEDIVIFSLTIDVGNVDKSLMPSSVILYGGQDRNEMAELKRLSIPLASSIVELLSNTNTYYKNIDILIKECHMNGRNCRINSLNIVGKRNDNSSAFKQPEAGFLCDYSNKFKEDNIDDSSNDNNVLEIIVNDLLGVDHTPHVLIYGVEIDSPNRIKFKDTYDNLNMMEYYKESMPLGNILQQKPTYVACGSNFTFYVNHQGSVFADGSDFARSEGLLGVGQADPNGGELLQLTTLNHYVIKKVAVHSNGLFAIAMTYDGRLFSWGHNSFGQLGLGHTMSMKVPQLVTSLTSSFILDVSCGMTHAAAITTLGEVFVWGYFGGLILDNDQHIVHTPKKVEALSSLVIIQVSCGIGGLTVLLDADHNVYAWVCPKEESSALRRDFVASKGNFAELQGDCTALNRDFVAPKGNFGDLQGNPTAFKRDSAASKGDFSDPAGDYTAKSVCVAHKGGLDDLQGDSTIKRDSVAEDSLGFATPLSSSPQRVECLCELDVVTVECGGGVTVALTGDGQVYSWDNDMNSPAVAIKFDTPVVHIATGPLYCFAVTKTKQVYFWRQKQPLNEFENDPGFRELAPELQLLESAQNVKLASDDLIKVACGSTHFIVYICKQAFKTSNSSIVETFCCKSRNNLEASACPEDIPGIFLRDNSPPLVEQVLELTTGAKQRAAEQLIYTLKIHSAHIVLLSSLHKLGLQELFRRENNFSKKNKGIGTSSDSAAVDTLIKYIETDLPQSDFIKCFNESSVRPLLHLMKMFINLGQMNHVRTLQSFLSVLTKDNATISQMCLSLMIKELDNVFSRYITSRNSHLTVSYYEKDVPQGSIYFKGGVTHLTVNISFNLMSIFNRRDDVKIYDAEGKLVTSFLYADEVENNRYPAPVLVRGNKIEYLDSVDPQWRGDKLAWNLEVHSHCKVNFLQLQAEPCLDTVKLLGSSLDKTLEHPALQVALWRIVQQPDRLSIRNTTWCVEKLVSVVSKETTPQLSKKETYLSNTVLDQHVFEQPTSGGDPYMNSDYFKNLLALSCKLDVNIPFQWFTEYRQAYQTVESLIQRQLPVRQIEHIQEKIPAIKIEVSEFEKITSLSEQQDAQLLHWFTKIPSAWKGENNVDPSRVTSCFGWGHNHRGQLGFLQTDVLKIKTPTFLDVLSDLNPSQIVAGDQSVFAVGWNGQVYAMGSNAQSRLGVANESPLQVVTKPTIVKLPPVVITKVAVNPSGRHTLALTSQGEVFVWGDNRHGQHGMHTADTFEKPRKITTFEKDEVIIDIACGGSHCELHMRMSSNEMARRQNKTKCHVPFKVKFQQKGKNLKVEKASCGPCDAQTFAITQDGSVWYWGSDEFHEPKPEDVLVPKKVDFLCNKGIIQVECGASFFLALRDNGSVYSWGKSEHYSLGQGSVQYIGAPQRILGLIEKNVTSIAVGALHCIACTSEGEVYAWGDNDQGQLGNDTTLVEKAPRKVLVLPPENKSVTAVCGSAHSIVLAVKEPFIPALPKSVPSEYYLLQDVPLSLLRYRMMYLYHVSSLIAPFLLMLPHKGSLVSYPNLKNRILYSVRENTLKKVIKKTMMPEYSRDYPPRVLTLKRNHAFNMDVPTDDMVFNKSTFEQMSFKYVPIIRDQLLLPSESVDDAGGGYNECLSELCEELRDNSLLKVLIPTPNSNDENGSNRDKFILNPDPFAAAGSNDKLFFFLGILLGIAIRTGHYLNLFLAEPIWTLLSGDILSLHDLMEIDQNFITVLSNMTQMPGEEVNALQMPFSTASSSNQFYVHLNPFENDITESNIRQYVVLVLQFRLHEFDERIHYVRKGLYQVIPVPLLHLFSGAEIETLVCSTPEISVDVLKQVTFYKDEMNVTTPQIIWFWEVLEEMSNQDRVLFIRFVSGRSRLAKSAREFRGLKFEIQFLDRDCDPDTLFPESSTCFFLLRLPRYTNKDTLKHKLVEAIHLSKAINTDDNILAEYLEGNESPVNSIDNSDVDE
ncbi:hypothetical protein M8J75_007266 [Diaphorina citri]|nr:hypothetical protein M8J75_007266 [Diaphorina citri]